MYVTENLSQIHIPFHPQTSTLWSPRSRNIWSGFSELQFCLCSSQPDSLVLIASWRKRDFFRWYCLPHVIEAPCSALEESSSLWSLYQQHVTKISFSFLFRPSCSFADRREVPANREQRKRHTAEQLSVSHESAWRSFPHFPSTSPKLLKNFFLLFLGGFSVGFFFNSTFSGF